MDAKPQAGKAQGGSHMKRKMLALSLCLAVAFNAAAAASDVVELDKDVSAYTRFLIYPHLDSGFVAMAKGDGKTAIAKFSRARELAPRNVQTALYLAEAYRRFGEPGKAEAVLAEQRRFTPNDPRLPRPSPAMVSGAKPATRSTDCTRVRTAQCRAQAGQDALRDGRLAVVEDQLGDNSFAASQAGVALRRGLAQRAIYLRDWPRAETQLSLIDAGGWMTPEERGQWLNVLLAQGKTDAARALQVRAGLDAPHQQLAVAQVLASRNDATALADYVKGRRPVFDSADDEKQWMTLAARAFRGRQAGLLDYRPRFAANRMAYAKQAVPALLASGETAGARRLLEELPADLFREERFTLALDDGDKLDEAQRHATALMAGRPQNGKLLDSLSYRLIQAGGDSQATRLLLDAYPFADGAATSLLQRLAGLAEKQPELFVETDRLRLRQPLASSSLRDGQAMVLAALKDCDGVMSVLGDLDPSYGADRWMQLGDCYRSSKPGLALYAYSEADRRGHDDGTTRAIAYQAFATRDYDVAFAAWRTLPVSSATSEDAIAAATTALSAKDDPEARKWLDLYASRGGAQDETYWWLRAQSDLTRDPVAARAALQQAIDARPDARYYALLANMQADAGAHRESIASLEQAIALDPGNAEARGALGYAYWNAGEAELARDQFEIAHVAYPDDPAFVQQLVYANQRVGDNEQARRYARLAIDALERGRGEDNADSVDGQRYALRRLHEDLGRRWRFSADMLLGTHATSVANSIDPAASYRSYSQVQADHRLGGAAAARDPEALVAYGRIFAGSGESGGALPFNSPTLGMGLRWKPFPSQVLYLSLEQQLPLNDRSVRHSDTLLRASASFLGDGRYSDDWHVSGRGWMTQNLYLDAAHYLKSEQSVVTAIYRVGLHRKISPGQTIEPYARLQYSGVHQRSGDGFDRDVRTGLGLRWNRWYGQTDYDAYRHKVSVGLEWQHALDTYLADKNAVFLILGGSW